ncbi:C-type lectin receptor-like tyrosine-protein kinase At1g52310 isoform X2 [Zingiber officinale]|uniref:C-type lectin receptor-like tyrosine-protein kinase At1g52310 isoform X2 n=1 Tax=Zingiber officinale TaxID=94328 RepID=UPI001C4D5AA7|nr:C-type lectin receptor-like tyrosine-protein kinase At1g52310 isoform X2 [Zingiber officinale]
MEEGGGSGSVGGGGSRDVAFLSSFLICFFLAVVSAQDPYCPDGWHVSPSKNKCFMHMTGSLPWVQSERVCQNFSGYLAALTSVDELSFAQSLCAGSIRGCWVGGRGYNSSLGFRWKWSDNISRWNESVFPGKSFHFDCSSASCNRMSPPDLCTLVPNSHVALVAESCNTSHDYICMVTRENKCSHKLCHMEYMIALAAVSGLILFITLVVVVWLLVYRRSKKRRRSRKISSPSTAALVPPLWKVFTSEELRSITKNFSEGNRLLGDAKTGGTYSGLLPDGSRVAVKRLKRYSLQRKKEFYSEIGRVAKLHHPNLVAVKGCCYDHGDRYIIYEFVANGPLDRWLHHMPRGGRSLDWAMRMRVATTLAQGIAFLHDKVKPQVVHRDIRASNVLLDEEFGSHLMGVGLSKIVPWEVMHERTKTAGTYGYLAPEFMYRNELTTKSDVYSFGVLLLEIISGRRPSQAVESVGWQTIFEWATPLVQSHRYVELLDPFISDIPEVGVIQKAVDLVYSCTQLVPSVRPRMSHVVHQLQQLGLRALSEQPRSGTSTSATSPMLPLEVEYPR